MKFIIPNNPKVITFSTKFRWWKGKMVGQIIRTTRKITKKKSLFENVKNGGNHK